MGEHFGCWCRGWCAVPRVDVMGVMSNAIGVEGCCGARIFNGLAKFNDFLLFYTFSYDFLLDWVGSTFCNWVDTSVGGRSHSFSQFLQAGSKSYTGPGWNLPSLVLSILDLDLQQTCCNFQPFAIAALGRICCPQLHNTSESCQRLIFCHWSASRGFSVLAVSHPQLLSLGGIQAQSWPHIHAFQAHAWDASNLRSMPRSKQPICISKCVALALEYCRKISGQKSARLWKLWKVCPGCKIKTTYYSNDHFLRFRTLLSRCGARMCGRACTLKVCSPHCKLQAM